MQIGKLYRLKEGVNFAGGVLDPNVAEVKIGHQLPEGAVMLYLGTVFSTSFEDWYHTWLSPDGDVVGRWYSGEVFMIEEERSFELCE